MTPSRRITTTSLIGMFLPILASSNPSQRQVHGCLCLRSLDHRARRIRHLVPVDVHILELLVDAERIEEPHQVHELTAGSHNHQGTRQDRHVRLSQRARLGKVLRKSSRTWFVLTCDCTAVTTLVSIASERCASDLLRSSSFCSLSREAICVLRSAI